MPDNTKPVPGLISSVDLSSKVFSGIYLRAISQEMAMNLILAFVQRLHFLNRYYISQGPMSWKFMETNFLSVCIIPAPFFPITPIPHPTCRDQSRYGPANERHCYNVTTSLIGWAIPRLIPAPIHSHTLRTISISLSHPTHPSTHTCRTSFIRVMRVGSNFPHLLHTGITLWHPQGPLGLCDNNTVTGMLWSSVSLWEFSGIIIYVIL